MVYAAIIGLLASGDLWAKWRIESQKPEDFPRPLKGTKDKVWLYRNHNEGFPFGLMKKQSQLVRTLSLAVTSGLAGALTALLSKKGNHLPKIALTLVIGGSLSNLYDRYMRHYVIDYFSLRLGPLKKVVFNLGDICIFLGSGLLFIYKLCQEIRRPSDTDSLDTMDYLKAME